MKEIFEKLTAAVNSLTVFQKYVVCPTTEHEKIDFLSKASVLKEINNLSKKFSFPGHKASMIIRHNDHTTMYMSIAEYLDTDIFGDESKEAKQECIAADELWELQWYPDTPIGFYKVFGPSLERCLEKAKQVEDD